MNRMAVGLAVGAGYVLGRTKKAKFAFAVGTMVAGKRLNLSPKALGTFVSQQLQNNPQFKEIGDQLRQDVRGVGKAATGSLLNRQLEGLADRLHDRTLGVQDRIAGVVPGQADDADEDEDTESRDQDRDEEPDEERDDDAEPERSGQRKKAPPKRTSRQTDAKPDAKSAPKDAAKTAAKKTPAKKSPQKPARKTAQKKSTAAARGTARRAASSASSARSGGGRAKGGSDHG
ncbi:DNA primase [Streptomyces sp. NPDC050732]|uniref:DNA primase n=1 Tax=Streptomyces sp. NPDC050732 TaxID=3154632 RepID=UPI00342C541C